MIIKDIYDYPFDDVDYDDEYFHINEFLKYDFVHSIGKNNHIITSNRPWLTSGGNFIIDLKNHIIYCKKNQIDIAKKFYQYLLCGWGI
jgi:hypothetical protein